MAASSSPAAPSPSGSTAGASTADASTPDASVPDDSIPAATAGEPDTAASTPDKPTAPRAMPVRMVSVRRVRNQHRLVSRSWLEVTGHGGQARVTSWLPVYFDPMLLALTESEAEVGAGSLTVAGVRLYPSGRVRRAEPPGVLVDNPSRPDPAASTRAVAVTRPVRRLLLDAQSTVAAPFAGLLWVYVMGGGLSAFAGASAVAGGAAVWLAAVRGSDPS
nr:hypothetical protein [Nocardia bovistercoris]